MRPFHDEEEVCDEDQREDDEGSDFEPGGELQHVRPFGRDVGTEISRKSLPVAHLVHRHDRSGVFGARTDDRGPGRVNVLRDTPLRFGRVYRVPSADSNPGFHRDAARGARHWPPTRRASAHPPETQNAPAEARAFRWLSGCHIRDPSGI
ncbi:hypothetical protein GCM10009750_16470 [Agromyces salentinus]|uniref:Uncharacterized protein n=1 Tax=Agromyces salentinus TaxID=269421 RepID=A0ABN2MN69_9MICO